MRTVIVGNRKLARHLLRHLLDEGWDIVGTLVPEGELAATQANFVPFEELIARTDCAFHETDDINGKETRRWLETHDPDICLCGGWSQIVDEAVLDIPDRGFLGLHSSRLPEGRGGAPVNWSIIGGADEVWISLFYYVPGVDAGDVVARESVPVEHRDDAETVFDKLAVAACEIVELARPTLEADSVDAEPQSLTDATYRPRRQPQDGLLEWDRSPQKQYDWIRAQTDPYPGAYTFHDGERLTVWRAEPLDWTVEDTQPGEVLDIVIGEGVDVRTGNGAIRLTRVQDGDRPPQWADRYARTNGLAVGDRLGRHAAPPAWRYTGIRGPSNPTDFETNLTNRGNGAVDIVAFAGSSFDITVRVTLDGEEVFANSVVVEDGYSERIDYALTDVGTHTLMVAFDSGGERVDTRYLKMFVGE
jgi:methionyl-tRNA formyltransferase